MKITVHPDPTTMGRAAAADAAAAICEAIAMRKRARVVVATGTSQLEVLNALAAADGIEWNKVDLFHLDEYVGLSDQHPASFRRYLRERFVEKLPCRPGSFEWIDAQDSPERECKRLATAVQDGPFDVSLVGIGENAHLAFNDPPANFEAKEPYIIVELDEVCRRQQVGEGWFSSLAEVPTRAISMSVPRILATRLIICSVPDERKAEAVRNSVEGRITPAVPASILQTHTDCRMHIDRAAASLLSSI
ncbi:MAG: glucosamine-6-phosphate deaminase [Planctomycetia bacterium]